MIHRKNTHTAHARRPSYVRPNFNRFQLYAMKESVLVLLVSNVIQNYRLRLSVPSKTTHTHDMNMNMNIDVLSNYLSI